MLPAAGPRTAAPLRCSALLCVDHTVFKVHPLATPPRRHSALLAHSSAPLCTDRTVPGATTKLVRVASLGRSCCRTQCFRALHTAAPPPGSGGGAAAEKAVAAMPRL